MHLRFMRARIWILSVRVNIVPKLALLESPLDLCSVPHEFFVHMSVHSAVLAWVTWVILFALLDSDSGLL